MKGMNFTTGSPPLLSDFLLGAVRGILINDQEALSLLWISWPIRLAVQRRLKYCSNPLVLGMFRPLNQCWKPPEPHLEVLGVILAHRVIPEDNVVPDIKVPISSALNYLNMYDDPYTDCLMAGSLHFLWTL